MKRISRLTKLISYLTTFQVPGYSAIKPVRVVDQDNATGLLSSAASGDQVLIALPEARDYGRDTDSFQETLSTAFFVLAKINGPARTAQKADEAYSRLLAIAQAIVEKFDDDITGVTSGAVCPLLAGMTLTDVSIVPEYSIFGGWSGWSIDITLG